MNIQFVWIPAHVGIYGNEQADRLAKEALKNTHIEVKIKCDYNEIILQIKEFILSEWQKEYDRSEKGKFYKYIEEKVSYQVKYKGKSKKKDITMTRLRLGRCKLNYYMYKMGLHDNGHCDTCIQPETIEHYLTSCKHSNIGYKLKHRCDSLGLEFPMKTLLSEKY